MLTLVCARAAEPPSPHDLMERLILAERANRANAAQYIYREDIREQLVESGGNKHELSWSTFEVNLLEGEPYNRRVAIWGQPLTPELEASEQHRYNEIEAYRRATPYDERRKRSFALDETRFRIDHRMVADSHDLRVLGEDEVDGRKVWRILATPRKGLRKPARRSEWSLSLELSYAIDQQTGLSLEIETRQLYAFDGLEKGSVTRVKNVEVEGIWLPEVIESRVPQRKATRVITQAYSNYRRFQATSKLLVDPD